MRPPYPTALVPLFPQFLQRRSAKADFPLRAMERLGLDRPAYFFVFGFGALDPSGERLDDIGNGRYRTTNEPLMASAAAAQGAGLVEAHGGRWTLTERGRQAVADHRRAIDAHLAALAPLPADELRSVAELLDRAREAATRSAEPRCREHTPRGGRYRWQQPSSPLALLDAAIYGLWQIRDDCHVQAWRDAGLDGPLLDVLTHLWRHEAGTVDQLGAQVPTQRPDDVRASLDRMRADGLLTDGEPLTLTARGVAVRDGVEAETDRYYFAPWPGDAGARGEWLVDRLAAVNAALA